MVELNISRNRLIEPDPTGEDAPYHVLFLGGSTTESLYVPEAQRWVALIKDHPEVVAYNAGQSGKTIIDNLQTFNYLTEQGYKFDLVVLLTTVNDLGWTYRLNQVGIPFTRDHYYEGMQIYAEKTSVKPQTLWERAAQVSRLLYFIDQTLDPEATHVVAKYRLEREKGLEIITPCSTYPDILSLFETNMIQNMQELYDAVAASGAKLLILSEPTSYGAPAESFFEDLRYISICDHEEDFYQAQLNLYQHANATYLQIAQTLGAFTYDYASAMEQYSNGENGGTYMYDSVHYTPQGSEKAAEILLPVILDTLSQISQE